MINAQCVTHVGIEVRNRCIRILLVSMICAWLAIKAISINYKIVKKHGQHEAEQLNHKVHTRSARETDLTGKCD